MPSRTVDGVPPSREALALHHEAVVIDLHADTLELVRLGYDLAREHRSMLVAGHTLGHVDLPRLRRGGVTAQVFGVVVPPWSTKRGARNKIAGQGALLEQLCESYPDELVRVTRAEEIVAAKVAGKTAAFLGVEGSHGVDENEDVLSELCHWAVRYLGPAHVFDSKLGSSSYFHREGRSTAAGHAFVEKLRDLGVIVDLAHMSRAPFLEVCRSSTVPVIVSHTGLAALRPMWRNIDDDQIRAVADTGGVIGVIMTPRYLGRPGVAGIVAHLAHLIAVGGADVAALGSDFDGLVKPPREMADVSGLPLITDALLRRGLGEKVIRKILGENVLRVLREMPPPARRHRSSRSSSG